MSLHSAVKKWAQQHGLRRHNGLIRKLRTGCSWEQCSAIEALTRIGDLQAVEALVAALREDNDPKIRYQAAEALGKIGDPRATAALIAALREKDYFLMVFFIPWRWETSVCVREQAALSLLWITEKARRVPAELYGFLDSDDRFIKMSAASCFAKIGDLSAVEPLIEVASGDKDTLSKSAEYSLVEMGEAAVPQLHTLLRDGRRIERLLAVRTLRKMGWTPTEPNEEAWFLIESEEWERLAGLGSPCVKPLVEMLKDDRLFGGYVRAKCAETLERIGWRPVNDTEKIMYLIAAKRWVELPETGQSAIEPLIEYLEIMHNSGSEELTNAAEALARLGGSRAVQYLTSAGFVEALGQISDDSAVDALVSTLLDSGQGMQKREAAARSLGQLGWKPHQQNELIDYLIVSEKWDELVRLGAEVVEPLFLIFKSESAGSRWRVGAMKALGELKAVGALTEILGLGMSWDLARAAEALGSIRDTSAVDALADAFSRTRLQCYGEAAAYDMVRDACANALVAIAGKQAIARVMQIACECGNSICGCGHHPLLDRPCALTSTVSLGYAKVASTGISILERIGTKAATEALTGVLSVGSTHVRTEARNALERLAEQDLG